MAPTPARVIAAAAAVVVVSLGVAALLAGEPPARERAATTRPAAPPAASPRPAAPSPVRKWAIHDLGTLGARRPGFSRAVDINDRGQVVGTSGGHAFLWFRGRMRDLGVPPGGITSAAVAINDRGQVLVNALVRCPPGTWNRERALAFVWQRGTFTAVAGAPVTVESYGAFNTSTVGVDINDRGQVTGFSYALGCDYDGSASEYLYLPGGRLAGGFPFVWRAGVATDLVPSGGDGWGRPNAINERGQVVGWVSDGRTSAAATTKAHPARFDALAPPMGGEAVGLNVRGQVLAIDTAGRLFLWDKGLRVDPGLFGGAPLDGSTVTTPHAINDTGQVVGWRDAGNGVTRAALWQAGRTTDLGSLGTGSSAAVAVNGRGQAIGTSGGDAFVWEKGRMAALGTLGGYTSTAVAINDRGQIAGNSQLRSGATHAVVWTRSGR